MPDLHRLPFYALAGTQDVSFSKLAYVGVYDDEVDCFRQNLQFVDEIMNDYYRAGRNGFNSPSFDEGLSPSSFAMKS